MSFLEEFEQELEEHCLQNDPPFCQAVCPFRLDIKGLEEKWKKGRFNAAFRTYQGAVGFPKIVSEICDRPCEKACIRCKVDGPIAIGLMEKATVDYAKRKTPNAYNLPSKGRKVAIVGGGLSGLGCALHLCNKKYEVTLFEKSQILGGRGRTLMDPAEFDQDLETQFQFESLDRRMGEEITSLEPLLKEFEAVYVATGAGGNDFGLQPDAGGAFATTVPGVFIGGGLTGRSVMEALADGLDVSWAIERFLKTGGMNEPFLPKGTRIHKREDAIVKQEPVIPANGERFTEEEAQREIARCEKCSCDACMKACDLMRFNEKTPRRIYEEVYITIRPGTLSRDGTWATRLITTCDQCGLCKQVCPEGIDIGAFFRKAMHAMHDKGAMPWPFHDYWLRDMEYSTGKAEVCRTPAGVEKSTYAFFPGCQLSASDARYVTKTYEWLVSKKPDTAMWMTCCGAPAEWAGDKALHETYIEKLRNEWEKLGRPTVIFACPNCRKLFLQYLPEIPGVFLPEVMEQWGIETDPQPFNVQAAPYSLFDPCASRGFPELQKCMRRLLESKKIPTEELPYDSEEARCCGYGGHINIAAPNYAKQVARNRISANENPYITYCVNCRESFAAQGKPVVHFLDLFFGLNDENRPQATVTERHDRKMEAKRILLEKFWNETVEEEPRMNLIVSKELERKLSETQILVQDMEQVVEYCEKELKGVLDPETGHITGHLKIQNMTYWAEYEVLGDGSFRLWNGYSHRMNLEGE